MKILFLLITFASLFYENFGDITYSKVLRDCENLHLPFIHDETHQSYKEVYIFRANKWNIKLYDNGFTYLNTSIIIDVDDLVKGDLKIFTRASTQYEL